MGQAGVTYMVTEVHILVCTEVRSLESEWAERLQRVELGDSTQFGGVLEGFPEEVRFEMISEGCVGANQPER